MMHMKVFASVPCALKARNTCTYAWCMVWSVQGSSGEQRKGSDQSLFLLICLRR